jgi:hypothetical protein
MKLLTLFIAALVLSMAAFGFLRASSDATPATGSAKAQPGSGRAHCSRPSTLRFVRYEDGSAQVRCAMNVLVRVSVPK